MTVVSGPILEPSLSLSLYIHDNNILCPCIFHIHFFSDWIWYDWFLFILNPGFRKSFSFFHVSIRHRVSTTKVWQRQRVEKMLIVFPLWGYLTVQLYDVPRMERIINKKINTHTHTPRGWESQQPVSRLTHDVYIRMQLQTSFIISWLSRFQPYPPWLWQLYEKSSVIRRRWAKNEDCSAIVQKLWFFPISELLMKRSQKFYAANFFYFVLWRPTNRFLTVDDDVSNRARITQIDPVLRPLLPLWCVSSFR